MEQGLMHFIRIKVFETQYSREISIMPNGPDGDYKTLNLFELRKFLGESGMLKKEEKSINKRGILETNGIYHDPDRLRESKIKDLAKEAEGDSFVSQLIVIKKTNYQSERTGLGTNHQINQTGLTNNGDCLYNIIVKIGDQEDARELFFMPPLNFQYLCRQLPKLYPQIPSETCLNDENFACFYSDKDVVEKKKLNFQIDQQFLIKQNSTIVVRSKDHKTIPVKVNGIEIAINYISGQTFKNFILQVQRLLGRQNVIYPGWRESQNDKYDKTIEDLNLFPKDKSFLVLEIKPDEPSPDW